MSRHQIKHLEKSNGLKFEIINEKYLQQENSVRFWNYVQHFKNSQRPSKGKEKELNSLQTFSELKIKKIEYCYQAIDFFFDIFLKDVPTENCSFGQLSPNKHPAIVEIVEDVIRDGVSLMAVDCANGKLAGIRLSYTITR